MNAAKKNVRLHLWVPPAFKAAIVTDAALSGRSLGAELVHQCMEAVGTAAPPAPEPEPAPMLADPLNPWQLLKDILDAVRQPDSDCVIPTKLGRRLQEMLGQYHRGGG